MIEVRCRTSASVASVWRVLADAWTVPAWVVGAARVDAAAAAWPSVGASMTYRVGAWPAQMPARSTVTACVPETVLALHGRLGRAGAVDMELVLRDHGSGSELVMREEISGGPGRLLPRLVEAALLTGRNREALRRLSLLAERPVRTPAATGRATRSESS